MEANLKFKTVLANLLIKRGIPSAGICARDALFFGFGCFLILGVADCAGVREDVADVGNTGDVHNDTFKPKSVSGMLGSTVLTEVEIPPIILLGQIKLCHASC